MKIAVASGKGGTGKTTIATSLALSLAMGEPDGPVTSPPFYLDCDVEGPNAHLFLAPAFERRQDVTIQIPLGPAYECYMEKAPRMNLVAGILRILSRRRSQ